MIMENETYIKYIDYYLPENYITVDDVFSSLDAKIFEEKNIDRDIFCSKFKKETRLDKISVLKKEDDLASIVFGMVDKLLKETRINPQEIDYLVCGNEVLLRHNNASIVHYIQKAFDFEKSTIIPLLQPCAASLFAMGLSKSLLDEEKKNMLILTACKWEQIEERFIDFTIRGDGIGLLLVGSDTGLLKITGWNSCNLGDSSYNKIENKAQGQDFRGGMISRGVSFIEETLRKFNLEKDEIEKVIVPNVRYDVYYDVYSHYLRMNPKLFYLDNVSNGGHICDIDIVRNLKDYLQNRKETKKHSIILYTPDVERTFDVNYHLVLLNNAT
jgi:3-oxoacyl-[acyl-carrier-protein] synthase-3